MMPYLHVFVLTYKAKNKTLEMQMNKGFIDMHANYSRWLVDGST